MYFNPKMFYWYWQPVRSLWRNALIGSSVRDTQRSPNMFYALLSVSGCSGHERVHSQFGNPGDRVRAGGRQIKREVYQHKTKEQQEPKRFKGDLLGRETVFLVYSIQIPLIPPKPSEPKPKPTPGQVFRAQPTDSLHHRSYRNNSDDYSSASTSSTSARSSSFGTFPPTAFFAAAVGPLILLVSSGSSSSSSSPSPSSSSSSSSSSPGAATTSSSSSSASSSSPTSSGAAASLLLGVGAVLRFLAAGGAVEGC